MSSFVNRLKIIKPIYLVLIAIVAVPLVGFFVYNFLNIQEAEVGLVKKGKASSAVYGTVTVEPVTSAVIRTRINGVISDVLVKEGNRVNKGDLLVTIDNGDLQTQLNTAKSAFENATDKRNLGPEGLVDLSVKRKELATLKRLYAEKAISEIELNRMISQVEELEKRVESEKLTLEAEYLQTREAYEGLKLTMEQGRISSPIDGVVLNVYARLGEAVAEQSQLLKIGSQSTRLRALVNEEDVGQIKSGMVGAVKLYSYQNKSYEAEVAEVLPGAQDQRYGVLLNIKDSPQNMMSGMTGEVNIIIGERNNVLIIPARGLRRGKAYVVDRGRVDIRNISTGYTSIEKVQVSQGLEEGEMIILSDHDLFEQGDKVKPILKD
ncbi:MAG: efflux RND transporter periplasmic adaptor subunit [Verrucomicrobiota bacterium]